MSKYFTAEYGEKPPERFAHLTVEQMFDVLPFQWKFDDERDALEAYLFFRGDDSADRIRDSQDVRVFPPFVSDRFIDLTEFSAPSIAETIWDMTLKTQDEIDKRFDREVLGLGEGESESVRHAYIRNSDTLAYSSMTVGLVAKAVRTTPEMFLQETASYVGRRALLQHGNFTMEFVRSEQDKHNGKIRIGIVRALSGHGRDLWRYLVDSHIQHDSRLFSRDTI